MICVTVMSMSIIFNIIMLLLLPMPGKYCKHLILVSTTTVVIYNLIVFQKVVILNIIIAIMIIIVVVMIIINILSPTTL